MQRRHFMEMMTAGLAVASGAGVSAPARLKRSSAPSGTGDLTDLAAFHAARRFAETPFGSIAYVERGRGEVAVFLHGFPLNGFQWRGALTRLSAHRRCIAPDFMGLGYTQITDAQSVRPDAQAAMIVALLDALAIDRVDVVANDSGGAVAQLLAAGHADRIRTLLLTNCDTEIESPPAALLPVIEMSKAGTFVDRWLGRWLTDKALARSADGIGGMCYADPAHPTDEAIECYFSPFVSSASRKAQVHAYAIALERNPLAGIEATLRRLHAPTRTVWGTADGIFSSAGADYLNRVCGDSRGVRRLERRKLFWPEELPEVVAEEAVRLWTSLQEAHRW